MCICICTCIRICIYEYIYIYICWTYLGVNRPAYFGYPGYFGFSPEPFKVKAICTDLASKLQLPLAFGRDASLGIWG